MEEILLYDHQSYLEHPFLSITVRLIISCAIGFMFGWERRSSGQPAGVRTFSVVCMSSTLLMLFSSYQTDISSVNNDAVRIDPTRMAQGIMTGIGFLGAGLLIKESFTIRGITTASMIWMSSAIGILIGIGFFAAAAIGTFLVMVVLKTAHLFDSLISIRAFANIVVNIRWDQSADHKKEIQEIIKQEGLGIARINESIDLVAGKQRLSFYANFVEHNEIETLRVKLMKVPNLLSFDILYKN